MGGYFISILYYTVPIAAVIFFVVSLASFLIAKSNNKRTPGKYSESQIKTRLLLLIISSVVAGVILSMIISFVILLSMAVAYM